MFCYLKNDEIKQTHNEINNEIKEQEYVYDFQYETEEELVRYYNKLVVSLYGYYELKFIDGNIYNLSNSNVRVMKTH
jgi:hypothetical protein